MLIRFKPTAQWSRSCQYALQVKPVQKTTLRFLSTSRPFVLKRAEEEAPKPNRYKQAKDILKTIEEKQALDKKNATKAAEEKAVKTMDNKVSAATTPKKTTLWQKIKAEAVHYWHGTKLLGLEIRISSRLVYKMLQGANLSRRENRQVKQIN